MQGTPGYEPGHPPAKTAKDFANLPRSRLSRQLAEIKDHFY